MRAVIFANNSKITDPNTHLEIDLVCTVAYVIEKVHITNVLEKRQFMMVKVRIKLLFLASCN
jgi:hypothetical protein